MNVPITVVVPVYGGAEDTERCLESVLRHGARVPFELLIIDDASPDPLVRACVDRVGATRGPVPIRVLRNAVNRGFVATANIGLREAAGDVVLLNSDTVVTAGWLDHLAEVARRADVATVTPLTNHGSICTLPSAVIEAFGLEGERPRIDECAEFVRRHSLAHYPSVITGVGFCMYVTRRSLDMTGLFDEEAFGRGYGEEVDFCIRASLLGMRHLVDDSTFVYHRGGVSFGDLQSEGWRRSALAIDERYEFFRPMNTRERAADPLGVPLMALELGLESPDPGRPHVLMILHSPLDSTGGTEKYVAVLVEALAPDLDFSVLYPFDSGFVLRTCWSRSDGRRVEREFLLPGVSNQATRVRDEIARSALVTALDMFDFDAVHVHNLIGHSLSALDVLADFPGPVVCSVHDLYLACPNFSLLYEKREPCGIPDDPEVCARCLRDAGESPMPGSPRLTDFSVAKLAEFRSTVGAGLDTVDHWVFPSRSAADYFLRVYEPDPGKVEIIPHGSVIRLGRRREQPDERLIRDEPLRVGFVGLGWSKKGLDAVNFLAESFRDTSVELHHFGESRQAASPEVHSHGRYDNAHLPELLHRAGIQVVLLPGAYAETFGIVMSEALVAGIPVIGARYGALGERIRATGAGWTIEPTDFEGIRRLIERLDRSRDEIVRVTRRVLQVPLETAADTAPRYASLYRS